MGKKREKAITEPVATGSRTSVVDTLRPVARGSRTSVVDTLRPVARGSRSSVVDTPPSER